eukprot:15443611-Alexandrium_andersonii.AAC.1
MLTVSTNRHPCRCEHSCPSGGGNAKGDWAVGGRAGAQRATNCRAGGCGTGGDSSHARGGR